MDDLVRQLQSSILLLVSELLALIHVCFVFVCLRCCAEFVLVEWTDFIAQHESCSQITNVVAFVTATTAILVGIVARTYSKILAVLIKQGFKIGFLAAFLVPLCLTVGVAMGKELLEDLMHQQLDSKINQRQYKRLDAATGKVVLTKSYQIRVIDIIRLGRGERCPADIVIIYMTDKTGQVLIQTDQLNGSTENKVL